MDINFLEIGASAVRVLLVGLVFGAGLPAVFAVAMRLQAAGAGALVSGDESTTGGAPVGGRRQPALTAVAYVLFAVVVAAVVFGVLFVTRHSLNHYLGISILGV